MTGAPRDTRSRWARPLPYQRQCNINASSIHLKYFFSKVATLILSDNSLGMPDNTLIFVIFVLKKKLTLHIRADCKNETYQLYLYLNKEINYPDFHLTGTCYVTSPGKYKFRIAY
jgi:hypothetical protein